MIIRSSAEFVLVKSPLNCGKNADANDWFAGRAETPATKLTDPDLPLSPLLGRQCAAAGFSEADMAQSLHELVTVNPGVVQSFEPKMTGACAASGLKAQSQTCLSFDQSADQQYQTGRP